MNKPTYFIIDFDSTFIRIEALDKLAEIALADNPKKDFILAKIKNLTEKGMKGEIPFDQSLVKRLKLFHANKNHLELLVKTLKKNITSSILRNKVFFKKYKKEIFVISGGFRDYITPLFKPFGIESGHILANDFKFSQKGEITGFDKKNLLSQKGGKTRAIKKLELTGKIYVIGDGYTDYEIKKKGEADKFYVFHENVKRDNVSEKADYLLPNFDEFLYIMSMPRAISYPKHRIKVLLLDKVDLSAAQIFKDEGFSVEYIENPLSNEDLIQKIKDAFVVGVRARTKLTADILSHAQKLMCAGRFGIGVDNIDLPACSAKGIAVFNAPFSSTRSVAELIIGEIIMLMRQIADKNMLLHKGTWDKKTAGAHEIRDKILGIVGYGNIGTQLSILAEALGMRVIFYDVVDKLPLGNARRCLKLEELLKQSDVISVHISGNPKTHVIGERELNLMKKGSYIINTSRGGAVDNDALVTLLKTGKIAGAAIDVFEHEPKDKNEIFVCQLRGVPNVILTPHIAGSTEESQRNIADFVSKKMLEFINLGNTYMNLTLPAIQLPKLNKAHRMLHLHDNVPGILAQINGVLAKHSINILGQYLKTNEKIGYVITDVDKKYEKDVLKELRQIQHTIKFRVLY